MPMIDGLSEQRLRAVDEACEPRQHAQEVVRERGPFYDLLRVAGAVGHGTKPSADGRICMTGLAQRGNLFAAEKSRKNDEAVPLEHRDLARLEFYSTARRLHSHLPEAPRSSDLTGNATFTSRDPAYTE